MFSRSLRLASLSAWALLAAAPACGGDRYIVVGTARAPSTSGYVKVQGTTARDTELLVHLEQLHPVDSLDPALHAYVVWFESGKDTPVRGGSLKYKPEERTGELVAKSPFRNFVVKVTAEANDTPTGPSAFVVASEQIQTVD